MASLINHDVRRALAAANDHYAPVDRGPSRMLAYLVVATIALSTYCVGYSHGAASSAAIGQRGLTEAGQERAEVPPIGLESFKLDGLARR